VEADVEFRFVTAAFLAWQASGDDAWIERLLPSLERALAYIRNHPWRRDEATGLVKRPYTIDTWDFAYTARRHDWLQFQIDDTTHWGIMHGDNSGYYQAFRIMQRLYDHFGEGPKAGCWAERARALRADMNRICWNGRFYTHFVKLTPVDLPGVEEEAQLSLSNPMAVNRGVTEPAMARSIIGEYLRRRAESPAFAEWFSIDPPFPDGVFGDDKLVAGAYVNGGIMPLVGGELARAAFESGFEEYGVDILRRYSALIRGTGESYLWYFPDGRPSSEEASTSPEATGTDGWGSSAMLYALIEGLAGIEDRDFCFRKVRLSPRWIAAGLHRAEVGVEYAASGAGFAYRFIREGRILTLVLMSPAGSEVEGHLLLPARVTPERLDIDGRAAAFRLSEAGRSRYCDFNVRVRDRTEVRVSW
jgi:hypothetical protein